MEVVLVAQSTVPVHTLVGRRGRRRRSGRHTGRVKQGGWLRYRFCAQHRTPMKGGSGGCSRWRLVSCGNPRHRSSSTAASVAIRAVHPHVPVEVARLTEPANR